MAGVSEVVVVLMSSKSYPGCMMLYPQRHGMYTVSAKNSFNNLVFDSLFLHALREKTLFVISGPVKEKWRNHAGFW